MVVRCLKPFKQIRNQKLYTLCRWNKMNTLASFKHSYPARTEFSCIVYKCIHHSTVGFEQIFIVKRIK